MRRAIVISQPMFFPWRGMFEQLLLADIFVFYDDVQFSKGSFTNRVQIKTASGAQWITVPVQASLKKMIKDTPIDHTKDWRSDHRRRINDSYSSAPYKDDLDRIVGEVFCKESVYISDLAMFSMEAVLKFYAFEKSPKILKSSDLKIEGRQSQRVLDIVKSLGGTHYITGHGARNYLDHELFEESGVNVEYIDYKKTRYPQLHGDYTPFVSVLDLIANCGKAGKHYFDSQALPWNEFFKRYP